MNNELHKKIHHLIQSHNIIVFMKGNKLMPMCSFSNTVIQILNKFNIDYHTINVSDNNILKNEIKRYSQWATIPQVYINGKFIGGADIIMDLYKTSKLHELLEKSTSS
uniref:putative monothiol glutaredoxin ycf64 like n=1 Tax=Catenella fusiformis TaxID=3024791 RepID=UPI0027D9D49E|nr:putative monothiol glutaredoxin ycf64 like [Catenella fusiformis]WCH57467.1 putative monothiol glutaredoxin ycf64 like [Catenella fusiformis]